MKKFFATQVAFLLLLAGMHVTVASHFCKGELAATKVTLTGKLASCGMAHEIKSKVRSESNFSSNCCQDNTFVYKVDESFSYSEFNFKKITLNILQEFNTPAGYSFYPNSSIFTNYANVSPPGCYFANAISMSDICVFRI